MKRSEVLQRLSMLIDSTENIMVPTSSYYDADALAEEILQFIERIGMLPPESTRSKSSMMFDLQHVQFAHIWDEDDFLLEEE